MESPDASRPTICVSITPFRRAAAIGSARLQRDVPGASTSVAPEARIRASAAAASVAERGTANSSPSTHSAAPTAPAAAAAPAPLIAISYPPNSPNDAATPRHSFAARPSVPSASVCRRTRILSMPLASSAFDPRQQLAGNLRGRLVFDDLRLPLLRRQAGLDDGESFALQALRFGALQRRHHRAHIRHAGLGMVRRFGQVAG